jgi:hypothetical protein
MTVPYQLTTLFFTLIPMTVLLHIPAYRSTGTVPILDDRLGCQAGGGGRRSIKLYNLVQSHVVVGVSNALYVL